MVFSSGDLSRWSCKRCPQKFSEWDPPLLDSVGLETSNFRFPVPALCNGIDIGVASAKDRHCKPSGREYRLSLGVGRCRLMMAHAGTTSLCTCSHLINWWEHKLAVYAYMQNAFAYVSTFILYFVCTMGFCGSLCRSKHWSIMSIV